MWKRYGFIGLLVLLGLSYRLLGQNTSAAYDDQLKGAIWTTTAQRIWTDTRQKPPAPPVWKTSAEFENWINTHQELAGKSELGLLRAAVINRFGKGQPATASQVAQAILTEVEGWKKTGALARVDIKALQSSLAGFTSVAPASTEPTPAATPTAQDSGVAAAAEDPNPAPDLPATPEPTVMYQTRPATYFGLSPAVAATLVLLLGAAVGAGVMAWLRPARRSRHRHRDVPLSSEPDTSIDMFKQDRTQKSEIQRLKGQLHHLERKVAELNAQLATHAPTPNPAPVAEPAPAPSLSDDDDLLTVVPAFEGTASDLSAPTPAPPTPPATRYGPVQETPFLEERKISDMPLPQLALMLTIHPGSPDEASFTLNPQVNQTMLIGDGLNRLQKFFEYDPPVGRISSVTAAAPGKLHRQADGWQVAERARLTIR